MDILKVIGALKKGRTTSEFVVAVVGTILTGGVGLGVIDFTPDQIQAVTAGVGEATETVTALKQADITLAEALIHIVGLIVGGHIMATYIKSRGDAKSAQMLAIAKTMIGKLDKVDLDVDKPLKPEDDLGPAVTLNEEEKKNE